MTGTTPPFTSTCGETPKIVCAVEEMKRMMRHTNFENSTSSEQGVRDGSEQPDFISFFLQIFASKLWVAEQKCGPVCDNG